jgi:hypothetical protein
VRRKVNGMLGIDDCELLLLEPRHEPFAIFNMRERDLPC